MIFGFLRRVSSASAGVAPVAPLCRTDLKLAQIRTFVMGAQNRSVVQNAQTRTFAVAAAPRTLFAVCRNQS